MDKDLVSRLEEARIDLRDRIKEGYEIWMSDIGRQMLDQVQPIYMAWSTQKENENLAIIGQAMRSLHATVLIAYAERLTAETDDLKAKADKKNLN